MTWYVWLALSSATESVCSGPMRPLRRRRLSTGPGAAAVVGLAGRWRPVAGRARAPHDDRSIYRGACVTSSRTRVVLVTAP